MALGREGRSLAEIAVELGVSLERLAAWACDHADFARAVELAATAGGTGSRARPF
jgi:hypothetical protein